MYGAVLDGRREVDDGESDVVFTSVVLHAIQLINV